MNAQSKVVRSVPDQIRSIREQSVAAMRAAREAGDHEEWGRILIRSQWAIEDAERGR